MPLNNFFFDFLELLGEFGLSKWFAGMVDFVPLEDAAILTLEKIFHIDLMASRFFLEWLALCNVYYIHFYILTSLDLLAYLFFTEMRC